jgi:hypothetical protein
MVVSEGFVESTVLHVSATQRLTPAAVAWIPAGR